jgi:hypothetical protein
LKKCTYVVPLLGRLSSETTDDGSSVASALNHRAHEHVSRENGKGEEGPGKILCSSFDISRHCFIDSIVNQSIFTATLYSLKTSCHTTEEETIAEEAAAEVTEGE